MVEGSTIRFMFTCLDDDGLAFTPTTRRLDVKRGDDTVDEDVTTSLVSEGVYSAKMQSNIGQSGQWCWEWHISNGAGDTLVSQGVFELLPQLIT